ncbi:MAG: ABC transporter permease, partial [Euryarchaeota archaeon]|nr:ABC transporter permease [Euryarchaeota archaeon]
MANRIAVTLISSIKQFYRSKSSVFWTIAFPVLLILIFGAIFSGTGGGSYTLHVQDRSDSFASESFLDALNQTGSISIVAIDTNADVDAYIRENSPTAVLIIPENFQAAFLPGAANNTTQLELRVDPTSSSANVIMSIVMSINNHLNLA